MASRSLGVIGVLAAWMAVASTPAPVELAGHADAKQRMPCPKYGSRPRRCVPVPRGIRRPAKIKPDDEAAVAPRNAGVLGGVGGGEGRREDGALDWAGGFTGGKSWAYRDERFVETAYAASREQGYMSAQLLRRRVQLVREAPELAPPGALMFFRADSVNRALGHVGLSLGRGRMLSALNVVKTTNVTTSEYWSNAYLGWSRAPSDWPGRLPVPFELIAQFDENAASLDAPVPEAQISGVVSIRATALLAAGIEFAAYFAEDPLNGVPSWHSLGVATPMGTKHSLLWDTTKVPNQGDPKIGTVTIAAITVGTDGGRRDIAAYRRVSLRNGP